MNRRMIVPAVAFVFIIMAFAPLISAYSESESAYGDADFLIDYGNGATKWIHTVEGTTVKETVTSTLSDAKITFDADLTTIDGWSERTIGSESKTGSLTESGTTGLTSTCSWTVYSWDGTEWQPVSDTSITHDGSRLALGYYPEGIVPVETPDYKASWTTHQGDAESSSTQTAEISEEIGMIWKHTPRYGGSDPSSVYGGSLVVRDNLLVKYGTAGKATGMTALSCYDLKTGEERWSFWYNPSSMDTTGPVVVGQYVYVPSNNGHIYRLDWRLGPGEDNENVTTIGGAAWDDETAVIPKETIEIDWYVSYICSVTAPVGDSGTIICKAYNGMTYCFDLDLNLLWSYQMEGHNYFTSPTVYDGYVYSGCYDGCLYIMKEETGELVAKQVVYQTTTQKGKCGAVATPVVIGENGSYTIFTTYSDGLGMDNVVSGLIVLSFDGSTVTKVKDLKDCMGSQGNYLTRYITDDFEGVIACAYNGIYTVDADGNYRLMTDSVKEYDSPHSSAILVNDSLLYITTYSSKKAFVLTLEGQIIGEVEGISTFAMAPPVVVDDYVVISDDNGVQIYYDHYESPVVPVVTHDMPLWQVLLIALGVLIVILAVIWAILRFGLKWEHPFSEIRDRVMRYFFGENYSHNTKSKRKVRAVLLFGIIITLIVSLISLCVGSETTLALPDALSAMFSAISKGGHNLNYEEMLIYNQRLPRVLAAIAVGIGLSVAGAMYQAVIKNPLVEPYIMGVSSGAGTFAVAVITFDFTFFGLFAAQSPYLTAFSAIVGGLVAFGLTMLLALKTGGKSINYVLAGIVIGLVFSAIQSVLMIDAGTKVASALSWLYGSFSTMTWDKLWLVLVPSITLSFVPIIWAREFNLVLLGEDQARQMGLNAKRFDAVMLIIASVLTSFCVAFCGIIGFVGLVIPHLSRMILGGDHRLMLPATMAFGGFLMVAADLLARVLLAGYELPVGAITTIIGVPVFAYLLVKRGRGYDG